MPSAPHLPTDHTRRRHPFPVPLSRISIRGHHVRGYHVNPVGAHRRRPRRPRTSILIELNRRSQRRQGELNNRRVRARRRQAQRITRPRAHRRRRGYAGDRAKWATPRDDVRGRGTSDSRQQPGRRPEAHRRRGQRHGTACGEHQCSARVKHTDRHAQRAPPSADGQSKRAVRRVEDRYGKDKVNSHQSRLSAEARRAKPEATSTILGSRMKPAVLADVSPDPASRAPAPAFVADVSYWCQTGRRPRCWTSSSSPQPPLNRKARPIRSLSSRLVPASTGSRSSEPPARRRAAVLCSPK